MCLDGENLNDKGNIKILQIMMDLEKEGIEF